MDILTLMTNNNCDRLRKTSSPDFRVPPINLDDLPQFLLGKRAPRFRFPAVRRQIKSFAESPLTELLTVHHPSSLQQRFQSVAAVMNLY